MKTCNKCNETKPRDAFYKEARLHDGLRKTCKECELTQKRERACTKVVHEKACSLCKVVKPASAFRKDAYNPDGLRASCRACVKKRYQDVEIPAEKLCTGCNTIKSKDEFASHRTRYDGLNYWCRECAKWHQIKHKYGLTKEEYLAMLEAQNHSCAVCDIHIDDYDHGRHSGFVVDHCHDTGDVRGLLCSHCNSGLGHFRDDPEILRKAVIYLKTSGDETS